MENEELQNSNSTEEVNNTEEVTTSQNVEVNTVVEEVQETVNQPATEDVATEVKQENVSVSAGTQDGYELVPSKKKGNKGPFIVIAIVIIALAAILYFAYTFISNPKKMFIKSVNKGYEDVEKFIDDAFTDYSNKKSMVLSNDLSLNVEVDDSLADESMQGIIDEINKIKLETEIGYDQKNKEMLMTIGALYDNETLINLGAYTKDENMYFELKDLFDKYIEVPLEDYDTYFEGINIDKDDLKYVLSKSKDAYINNLEEDNFKKENATIKINGKNVKTTKITYALSEQKGHELSKKALTELVEDSKYIEALASLSGQDKEDIKESLEEALDEITEEVESGDLESETAAKFIVYTKGFIGESVGYEIVVDSDDESASISYYKGDSKDEFKFVYNDEEIMNATISDNKVTFEMTYDEQTMKFEVLKKEKDKKTTYSYTITVDEASINGDVVVEMIKENKDGSYEANISSSASLMGMVKVTISGKSKLEYKDSLELPDVSNSVDYEELTEEDMNAIQNKLLQNEALVSLITKISEYADSMNEY